MGDRVMEIMKLIPTGKDYLWGGTRLREEYGKKIDLTPLAETWKKSAEILFAVISTIRGRQ